MKAERLLEELRLHVQHYDGMVLSRMGLTSRFQARVRRGVAAKEDVDSVLEPLRKAFAATEREEVKQIEKLVKQHPAYGVLSGIVGLGPVLIGRLIAIVQDVGRFDTVSKLWKYVGMDVRDGKAPKRKRGEKSTWSPAGRRLCYNIGDSFIKSRSPYREFYDLKKALYRKRHPEKIDSGRKSKDGKVIYDYTDGHVHAMARRYMVKLFLSHAWELWRQVEGLPVRAPYAMEYLGHTGQITPEQMKAKPKAKRKTKPKEKRDGKKKAK